jgi:hypothetical protein
MDVFPSTSFVAQSETPTNGGESWPSRFSLKRNGVEYIQVFHLVVDDNSASKLSGSLH